jgi:hypothetical protein
MSDVVATNHDETVMTHDQSRISNRNHPNFRELVLQVLVVKGQALTANLVLVSPNKQN